MFKTNLFRNTLYATTALAANCGMAYHVVKSRQRDYDALKKANPNATITWEYQEGNGNHVVGMYGSYGSGGFKWVAREPEPTATPTTPRMKR